MNKYCTTFIASILSRITSHILIYIHSFLLFKIIARKTNVNFLDNHILQFNDKNKPEADNHNIDAC